MRPSALLSMCAGLVHEIAQAIDAIAVGLGPSPGGDVELGDVAGYLRRVETRLRMRIDDERRKEHA